MQIPLENEQYYTLLGYLSTIPEEDRAKVQVCIEKIKAVINESPQHGLVAVALIGAEAANKP